MASAARLIADRADEHTLEGPTGEGHEPPPPGSIAAAAKRSAASPPADDPFQTVAALERALERAKAQAARGERVNAEAALKQELAGGPRRFSLMGGGARRRSSVQRTRLMNPMEC